jgi:D-3-phosphoglycerate dehydrogenase
VILAPHAGWYSDQSVQDLKRKTAEAAVAVLRGERPYSVVNPAVLTSETLRAKGALI